MQKSNYALIFYTLDTQRCTMRLTHEAYSHLEYIWAQYKIRLGYYPDQYGGHPLKLAQIRILLQIIDHYAATADLNANREATKTIPITPRYAAARPRRKHPATTLVGLDPRIGSLPKQPAGNFSLPIAFMQSHTGAIRTGEPHLCDSPNTTN